MDARLGPTPVVFTSRRPKLSDSQEGAVPNPYDKLPHQSTRVAKISRVKQMLQSSQPPKRY